MDICIYIYIYTNNSLYMYALIYAFIICIYVCIHICIYAYTCKYFYLVTMSMYAGKALFAQETLDPHKVSVLFAATVRSACLGLLTTLRRRLCGRPRQLFTKFLSYNHNSENYDLIVAS